MEKPFYISQLPEKTQAWIKEKTKENFLKDGMSEEEAEQKATDFLDEKVNVAEDFFGKDFYKSLDAIKDNFTPPGAKGKSLEDIDQSYEGKNKEITRDLDKQGWAMTPFVDRADYFKEQGYDVENKGGVYMIKPKSDNSSDAKGEKESNPQAEVRYKTPEDLMIPTMSDEDLANSIDGIERGQSDLTDAEKPIALGWIKDEMKKRKSTIDTNNNGKIETDEMADFQKSLDDYATKNKKGREDIPATYKR